MVLEGMGRIAAPSATDPLHPSGPRAGYPVGFVTSGKTLNEAYINDLVESGPYFIGFSLNGATPADAQRHPRPFRSHGADRHIRSLQETKARLRPDNPGCTSSTSCSEQYP